MNLDDLREQVEIEFENLRLLEQETTALLKATRGREPTVVERTAAGAFLAQFYGGVESVMKRFVKGLDARMPAGDAWHMELARMFIEGSESGLPALFSREQFSVAAEFRKCRHAVRNCYGHELQWTKLQPLMALLPKTLRDFEMSVRNAMGGLGRRESRPV